MPDYCCDQLIAIYYAGLRRGWQESFNAGREYGLIEASRSRRERRAFNTAMKKLDATANGHGAIPGEDRAAPMTMSND